MKNRRTHFRCHFGKTMKKCNPEVKLHYYKMQNKQNCIMELTISDFK